MKRLVTLVTVLLVGLASVQAAQPDDQQKKKKKQTQAAQTTSAQARTSSRTQTSKGHVSTQTGNETKTGKKSQGTQPSNSQQVTNRQVKKAHVKPEATQNTQVVRSNKANKSKKQTNVVTNNNVNKKAFKQFKRTGNEVSFNVARSRIVRERHDRNWWHRHYSRIILYGGGYWYWNAGWWYPAWGYSPYYNNYFYNGPIFGYGYASPFDVTAQVQRALAARGYYYGPIDGTLGPGTRSAIQRYQIDHGLYATAAIDEPTLYRLGLA